MIRRTSKPMWALFALLVAAVSLMVACGGEQALELSARGAEGREIANDNGCAACHGKSGQGSAGPAWQGLYQSEVELSDGTVVVADEQYLLRSIHEPEADIVDGFTIRMPVNSLTDEQAAAVVDYIIELEDVG